MNRSARLSLWTGPRQLVGKATLSLAAVMILAGAGLAQTTTPPTTTPAPSPSDLTALTVEQAIPVANIFAAVPVSLGAAAQAVASGALELRQRIIYTPFNNNLEVRGFLVQPGTAVPAPSLSGLTTAWLYNVRVDRLQISNTPVRNILFSGPVTSTVVTTPFGDLTGSTVTISFGYAPGAAATDPATFTALTTNVSGAATLYSATGSGSYTIRTTGSGGNNGGGGTTPAVTAVAGPKNATSFIRSFQLSAAGSTSTTAGALTYMWTVVNNTNVSLSNPTSPNPTVVFAGGQGNYTFQLKVTDAAGNTATDTVTVFYSGR